MRRIRIEKTTKRPREDRSPILPLDPRDPDVSRIKRGERASMRDRTRL